MVHVSNTSLCIVVFTAIYLFTQYDLASREPRPRIIYHSNFLHNAHRTESDLDMTAKPPHPISLEPRRGINDVPSLGPDIAPSWLTLLPPPKPSKNLNIPNASEVESCKDVQHRRYLHATDYVGTTAVHRFWLNSYWPALKPCGAPSSFL